MASVAVAVQVILVALAGSPAGPLQAGDKPTVVATFSVLGDMVANVAGDHANLVTIVGPDGDTELYRPTLADGRTIADARIVFTNDLNDDFEPWLEPLLKQAGFAGTKVVVSRGAQTITAEEEHPISGKEAAPVIDQHAWMDRKNGIVYVEEHCPGPGAARFRQCLRLQGARGRLRQGAAGTRRLDADRNDVPAAKRRVISSRDLLEYLAEAYGITLISIYGWTNKSEPSAAEVSRLARQIEQEHVRALFLDNITDPRIMQRIAKETGAAIGGTLYGDALSKPGGEADSYIRMLRYDVTTLKAGMLKN